MKARLQSTPRARYDESWKQVVQALFQQFMRFYVSGAATLIDFDRPPVFRPTELRRIAKGITTSGMTADILVSVFLKTGEDVWIIVHVELQSQKDEEFALRMFLYNVQAYDLFRRPIYSLAILADDNPNWRPDRFEYNVLGSHTSIHFPMVKLLDYVDRQDYLAKSRNPFGVATLAMLRAHETQGDAVTRFGWKTQFAEMLYARGWKGTELDELLLFIDLVMPLPAKLEERYEADLSERIRVMKQVVPPMLKYAEKRGEARGEARSKREMLMYLLQSKFGPLPADVTERVEAAVDAANSTKVKRLLDAILTTNSLADMPMFEQ